MTPSEALALYRNAIELYGEPVVIEAAPIANSSAPPASGPSRARIMNHSPEEIAGGVTAASRKMIVLHEDLAGTPYADGLRKGARVKWNGRTLTVATVDIGTRGIAGVPIAYTASVSGA